VIQVPRALALAAAIFLVGHGVAVRAEAVVVGGRQIFFSPPSKWEPSTRPPEGLLAFFKPPGARDFPHLAVSDVEGGDARTTLSLVRRSLPALYGELGVDNPRPLLSPTIVTGSGPARVDFSFSGEIGGRAFDWYQCIVSGAASGAMFTFAFPRGTLESWRPALEEFFRSLRVAPEAELR